MPTTPRFSAFILDEKNPFPRQELLLLHLNSSISQVKAPNDRPLTLTAKNHYTHPNTSTPSKQVAVKVIVNDTSSKPRRLFPGATIAWSLMPTPSCKRVCPVSGLCENCKPLPSSSLFGEHVIAIGPWTETKLTVEFWSVSDAVPERFYTVDECKSRYNQFVPERNPKTREIKATVSHDLTIEGSSPLESFTILCTSAGVGSNDAEIPTVPELHWEGATCFSRDVQTSKVPPPRLEYENGFVAPFDHPTVSTRSSPTASPSRVHRPHCARCVSLYHLLTRSLHRNTEHLKRIAELESALRQGLGSASASPFPYTQERTREPTPLRIIEPQTPPRRPRHDQHLRTRQQYYRNFHSDTDVDTSDERETLNFGGTNENETRQRALPIAERT